MQEKQCEKRGYEMKRALLIAGGTVGGLGAVLAITPPQLGATNSLNISSGAVGVSSGTTEVSPASSSSASATASPQVTTGATKSAKPVATKKSSAGATATASASASASASATASASQTPAPVKTTAAPTPVAKSGTFTGPSIDVKYGFVQVKITVVDGRITDAVAVKAPSGRNDRYTNMAVPILKKQTLAAQSANIQGASGASYTSYGWYTSLQGALNQAGL
jgi:uncharacterized protein with FMN-binding domain